MTLSPAVTRVQQSSSSNAAALRAANLSFSKKVPASPKQAPDNHNAANRTSAGSRCAAPSPLLEMRDLGGKGPILATQTSFSGDSLLEFHSPSLRSMPTSPRHPKSSPMVAANLAAARFGGSPKKGDSKRDVNGGGHGDRGILPIRGTMSERRRLFEDDNALQEDSSTLPASTVRMHKTSGIDSRPSSAGFQGVDATSLEDISSLKSLFEKSVSGQHSTARLIRSTPSPLHALKPIRPGASPDNPSLTAAILATQLSPSSSVQNSRRGSPILKPVVASARRSPTQRSFPNHLSSPDALPMLSLTPPHNSSRKPRLSMPSIASEEPVPSKVSATSDRNNALLAATLASKLKSSTNSQPKVQPPKPPPPRRAQNGLKTAIVASNDRVSDAEDDSDVASVNLAITTYSQYGMARSSTPLRLDRFSITTTSVPHVYTPSTPPPSSSRKRRSIEYIPRQSTGEKSSAALTAAVLSATSSCTLSLSPTHSNHDLYNLSPSPRHLNSQRTGDSARAASLAPSRVTSPAPKKPPAPPAPRRGRRKSLPPPPKTGLRETMRKPPKTPPKDTSPQRRKPHLVKHHPHKHSEGERRRWRHFITESERKRYEGLWAANKGLLLIDLEPDRLGVATPSAVGAKSYGPHNFQQQQHVWSSTPDYTELLADCVDSLVARDIWSRSRLPFDHLADVWDLVDRGEKGRLSRDEFVVGTWLVDQSLKGRRLPTSVQDEVWQSVRRLGVKI